MKSFLRHIIIDSLYWLCLYQMVMQTSYVNSAETVVYLFVAWNCLMGIVLYICRPYYKEIMKDVKPNHAFLKRTPLWYKIYGKLTTALEIVAMCYGGYLVCGFLYLVAIIINLESIRIVKEVVRNETAST